MDCRWLFGQEVERSVQGRGFSDLLLTFTRGNLHEENGRWSSRICEIRRWREGLRWQSLVNVMCCRQKVSWVYGFCMLFVAQKALTRWNHHNNNELKSICWVCFFLFFFMFVIFFFCILFKYLLDVWCRWIRTSGSQTHSIHFPLSLAISTIDIIW